jgi:hypothetical protein
MSRDQKNNFSRTKNLIKIKLEQNLKDQKSR